MEQLEQLEHMLVRDEDEPTPYLEENDRQVPSYLDFLRNESAATFETLRHDQGMIHRQAPFRQRSKRRLVEAELGNIDYPMDHPMDHPMDQDEAYPVELYSRPPSSPTTRYYHDPNDARLKREKQRLRELHFRRVQRRRAGVTRHHSRDHREDEPLHHSIPPSYSSPQVNHTWVTPPSSASEIGYHHEEPRTEAAVTGSSIWEASFAQQQQHDQQYDQTCPPQRFAGRNQQEGRMMAIRMPQQQRQSVDMVHHDSPIGPAVSVYPTDFDWKGSYCTSETAHESQFQDNTRDRASMYPPPPFSTEQYEEPDGGSLRQSLGATVVYKGPDNKGHKESQGFVEKITQKKPATMVEISPGVRVPLRGAAETKDCVRYDHFVPCQCCSCDLEMLCIKDAEYVLCPSCRVINPLSPDNEISKGTGLGLGFTWNELARMQEEIISSRIPLGE
mmetsp:Transcript_4208/g.8778  ORF Transcript_4208/g.8778 Transcript_4208/m.8778 type:complete len:445 (-) Transcript_4208:56-1390(-)|eukprot:CAMPEP_0168742208 /NCGR_PEP_ID=MMETSP0724-20121128/12916_1 /TAXON_ID=265536 /ORGANISM="Amphiprora sp., Strain CCMP467" /LENGTH=444 /DNA_ID=CAMNT_0008789747 /DNA_START=226 /DNA_END=1560 /DNA_ORIENTATION=-